MAEPVQYGVWSEDGVIYRIGVWRDGEWVPGSREDADRECASLQVGEPTAKVVRCP